MTNAGYTTIFNDVLRDIDLSLEAKGLYTIIKSFVGLPGFVLSKRRLSYACSSSTAIQQARILTTGLMRMNFAKRLIGKRRIW